MPEKYDYFKRVQSPSWLIAHIENLIYEARTEYSTSSVLYSAFEVRNLIEKICYDLILMSTNQAEWNEIEQTAKGKQGIRRSNEKYKSLKYRYQTFSEAIGRISNLPIKAFDYKKAEELENELGEYLHTYTRNQIDMDYASNFIQEGLKKVEESLTFIKSYFVQQNGNNVFGVLNFSTLTGKYKTEFDNWKNSQSNDTEALHGRLAEINKKEPIEIKKK